jgi:sulfite reductase beta subunit-like hemoprotein
VNAIVDAKRAGLPVDLDRLAVEGDDWLSAADRYSLKPLGVCAQAQPHLFMIRCRTGGRLTSDAARGLSALARAHGQRWLHLTTRQQIELHHIHAREVASVLGELRAAGLGTDATCGHTMRGVMACPDAGVGLDEPFDCGPDARLTAQSVLAQGPALAAGMPQRLNICFGGCVECRAHAKVNDIGFVSTINNDGELGYELWVGGSLGKSAPTLSRRLVGFLPRSRVLAATRAVFEVFCTHSDLDQPNKARLKFLIRRLGFDRFAELFGQAYERALRLPWPAAPELTTPLQASIADILSYAPAGGWGSGVRPQRLPGRAMVTVTVPLGDLDVDELVALAELADTVADQHLYLTRNQNVLFRHVPIKAVAGLRAALSELGLSVFGADQSRDIRACTGGPVCSLALTPAARVGHQLGGLPALARNCGLRVHISGCPNNCAQHQIGDLGFSGGLVTIRGRSTLGYQVYLGGDLRHDVLGAVVGRVAATDVPAITEAVIGVWEALRERGETLTATIQRFGVDAFTAQINVVFAGRWEPGPEPGHLDRPDNEPTNRRRPVVTAGIPR